MHLLGDYVVCEKFSSIIRTYSGYIQYLSVTLNTVLAHTAV